MGNAVSTDDGLSIALVDRTGGGEIIAAPGGERVRPGAEGTVSLEAMRRAARTVGRT